MGRKKESKILGVKVVEANCPFCHEIPIKEIPVEDPDSLVCAHIECISCGRDLLVSGFSMVGKNIKIGLCELVRQVSNI